MSGLLYVVHSVTHLADEVALVDGDKVSRFLLNRNGGGYHEEQVAKTMEQLAAIHRGEAFETVLMQGGRLSIKMVTR